MIRPSPKNRELERTKRKKLLRKRSNQVNSFVAVRTNESSCEALFDVEVNRVLFFLLFGTTASENLKRFNKKIGEGV